VGEKYLNTTYYCKFTIVGIVCILVDMFLSYYWLFFTGVDYSSTNIHKISSHQLIQYIHACSYIDKKHLLESKNKLLNAHIVHRKEKVKYWHIQKPLFICLIDQNGSDKVGILVRINTCRTIVGRYLHFTLHLFNSQRRYTQTSGQRILTKGRIAEGAPKNVPSLIENPDSHLTHFFLVVQGRSRLLKSGASM